MATQAKLIGTDPASNPASFDVMVTFSGDYGDNGTGDPLNLAPYDEVNNPGGVTNPDNLPMPALPGGGLEEAPAVLGEDIGGYYVNPHPLLPPGPSEGVAQSLALKNGVNLRMYAPGGGELATGAAYNAAVTAAGAGVILRVTLPKDQ